MVFFEESSFSINNRSNVTKNCLPSDVPGLRTLFHRGSAGAHVENVLQALKFRLVRKELAVGVLAMIQRLEERVGEHLGRGPVRHGVRYHHRFTGIRVADCN